MKTFNKLFFFLFALFFMAACGKEETKEVDFSKYNDDNPQTKTALDDWLRTTFLDEYNIDVVYRYNRYYHEMERNVTPPYLDAVKPTMELVLDGFIMPYRRIGGEDFIKKMVPKEWILFGSNSYASDGGVYAGTASAGRRINLYGVNAFRRFEGLLVIHHEFTHILNQLVSIPTDFEPISKADYKATWQSTKLDTARKYGFVTSYASGSYTEDYAETTAHLLVKGQAWYDEAAMSSSEYGKRNMKLKEQNVVNYFSSGLKMDFRKLQKDVRDYILAKINPDEYLFQRYLTRTYKYVLVNMNAVAYSKYPVSNNFKETNEKLKSTIASSGRTLNHYSLIFNANNQATIRINYNSGTSVYDADYSFSYTYNFTSGELKLTKVNQAGTEGNFANANNAAILKAFNESLLPYFNGKTFMANWLKGTVDPGDFNNLAGFTEKGNETNYWFGAIGI